MKFTERVKIDKLHDKMSCGLSIFIYRKVHNTTMTIMEFLIILSTNASKQFPQKNWMKKHIFPFYIPPRSHPSDTNWPSYWGCEGELEVMKKFICTCFGI